MQPKNHHLAELNVGRLIAPTDDPRVADFMNALDQVNGLGKRMPGFVWMMEGSGEPGTGNTENNIGDDPQFVANLTVWQDVKTLENFVWNTVHRQFYERRQEWFEVLASGGVLNATCCQDAPSFTFLEPLTTLINNGYWEWFEG